MYSVWGGAAPGQSMATCAGLCVWTPSWGCPRASVLVILRGVVKHVRERVHVRTCVPGALSIVPRMHLEKTLAWVRHACPYFGTGKFAWVEGGHECRREWAV